MKLPSSRPSKPAKLLKKLFPNNHFVIFPLSLWQGLFNTSERKGKNMRLDKYLKVTRLIKRRTIANEACDAGRVLVNGKVARASYEVKEDDVIEIQLGQRPLKVQVVSVTESPRKEEAAQNYKVIE